MSKPHNLEGKRFGRLVAIEMAGYTEKDKKILWKCRCDCGNEKIVRARGLTSGHTRSCGCLASEYIKEKLTTHGKCHTRLHNIWKSMIERCTRKTHEAYHNYGGRGITICDEWKKFEPFYEWGIANGYDDKLTLDRIDVNGNYEPSNCKWSTYKEQGNNRRTNTLMTFNGETKTQSMWADETGISYDVISHRLKRGWSVQFENT